MTKGPENYTADRGDGGHPGPDRKFVARRLKEARIAAGLSQAEAARRAGISPVSIFRLERGDHLPRRTTLGALARAYGRSPDWFTDPSLATSGPRWHGERDPDLGPGSDMEVMSVPLIATKAGICSLGLDMTPIDWYPMRQDKLVAEGTCARHCGLVEVRGDSMSRRCPPGSLVLVDMSRREFRDGRVHLPGDRPGRRGGREDGVPGRSPVDPGPGPPGLASPALQHLLAGPRAGYRMPDPPGVAFLSMQEWETPPKWAWNPVASSATSVWFPPVKPFRSLGRSSVGGETLSSETFASTVRRPPWQGKPDGAVGLAEDAQGVGL